MADKLVLELLITDSGTPVVRKFAMESKQALDQATQGVDALTGSLGKNKDTWPMVLAGAASAFYMFEKIYAIGKDMVDSYAKQEAAEMKLAMAMRNQGEYSAEAFRSLTAYATKLQDTTTVSDEAAIGVMALLKTFGMSDEQVKRSTQAVLDLSTVMDKDLNATSMLVGKAFLGNEQALGKWGIKIDQTLLPSQKFEAVLAQLEQRFGGAAQAMIETHGGKMTQWKNKVDEAKETVGGMALTALPFMSLALLDVNTAMGETTKATSSVENAMAKLPPVVGGFKPVADETVKALDKLNKALEKFALEQGLVGATDLQKQIGMLQVEVKEYEKAGVDKTKILEFQSKARQLLIEQYQQKQKEIEIVAAGKEIEAHMDHLNALALQKAEMQKGYNEQELKNTIATIEAIGKASDDYFDKLNDDTRRGAETWIAQDKRATEADLEYKAQMVIATKTGLAREIAEVQRATDIKIREYERQLKENLINQKTFDTLILSANEEKNTKIGKATEENAKWILGVNKSMEADIAAFTHQEGDVKRAMIEEEYRLRALRIGDSVLLEKWRETELKKIAETEALTGKSVWDGLAAARDKYYRDEASAGAVGAGVWRDVQTAKTGFTKEFVDNFIAGQDLMVSAQKAAGDVLISLSGNISQRMWNAALDRITQIFPQIIENICGIIGAYIGEGAAESGAEGASWGGVTGALSEIGLYLSLAVGSMVAGKGLAQAFKTEGGWVASHPMGGWIQEGSGSRDDVFLGVTPGARHWGMGGEFVVNKHAAIQHAPLLEAINQNYDTGGPIGTPEKWTGLADSLVMGSAMSFMHGFSEGGVYEAIIDAIVFNAAAIPAMFLGKTLQNSFRERGGWLDVGHGLFDSFFPWIFPPQPWQWVGLPADFPFQFDAGYQIFEELKKLIPGSQYLPDPYSALQNITDPEKSQEMLKEILRDPYKQIAKDILTPGKFCSDAVDITNNLLTNFQDIVQRGIGIQTPTIFSFHDGGTADRTGLAFLEKGERVIPFKGARSDENNISALIVEVKALRADLQNANSVINFNIEGNVIGDENAFNNFVKKIDYTLTKIRRREYGPS